LWYRRKRTETILQKKIQFCSKIIAMEGHRMAKRLSVYHEVYRAKIAGQTDENPENKVRNLYF